MQALRERKHTRAIKPALGSQHVEKAADQVLIGHKTPCLRLITILRTVDV
jgi:hypothetical protein